MRKYSKEQIQQLAAEHGVGERTAYRWLLSGSVEYHVKRRAEWNYLRAECAKNGTTRYARYCRKAEGYPLEAIAGPMKRVGT